MKKYIMFITFCFTLSAVCLGQNNNEKIEESLNRRYEISFDPEGTISSTNKTIFKEESLYTNGINTDLDLKNLNLEIEVSKPYEYPPDNYLSNSKSPFSDDYHLYYSRKISNESFFETYSIHETYLTIGSLSKIEIRNNYSFNDNINISIGLYTAKYNIWNRQYGDGGINLNLKYKLTDNIYIHGWGQYSGYAKRNKIDTDRYNMFLNTHVGGALEYRITNKFGIIGGMERQFNPMNRKWKNNLIIAPIF